MGNIGLKEESNDGVYLVFPSQFIRDWPDAPDPEGKAVMIMFEGPLQNIYATMAVRLAHSGLFSTAREDMWRNAIKFKASAGGICGIYLRERMEGQGELILFYSRDASPQTRFHFEEYILTHLKRRAIDGSIKLERLFVCTNHECGHPVPEAYAKAAINRGEKTFPCGSCLTQISLEDTAASQCIERHTSKIGEMDAKAEQVRQSSSNIMTLRGRREIGEFDVFLCYNSKEIEDVKRIGEQLKERNILPWLDIWEMVPGERWLKTLEKQIKKIKTVAVFIGPKGKGPWQDREISEFLVKNIKKKCRIIPVILPGRKGNPRLPIFLNAFHCVDFRKNDPDPLEQLVYGITGKIS